MKKIRCIIKNYLKENPSCLKAGILTAAAIVCTAGLYAADNSESVKTNEKGEIILKREQGEKETIHEMKVRIGESGSDREIEVPVSGRIYDSEEIRELFTDAGSELEKLILGENESLDNVRYDLNLITEIPGTGIQVAWETDNYDVIDIQGNLGNDRLSDSGTQVRLTARLSYEENQALHEFYVCVFPPIMSEDEQLMQDLKEKISLSDEKTKTEDYIILPDSVDGKPIRWKYGTETRAFAILILGAGTSCMIVVSSSQRKKEDEKKIIRQMNIDYPQIINKFNLYIRAGMTIRRAWFCIAQDYEKKRGQNHRGIYKRKAYEEMVNTMNQIRGGIPEGEAYENYGTRCSVSIYRKFGTLLSQNLRKGSKGLTELLGREAEEAFEERKNLAKKLGEEAGTKLVIPLFLMLIIVFAIVIVPAFFSISI